MWHPCWPCVDGACGRPGVASWPPPKPNRNLWPQAQNAALGAGTRLLPGATVEIGQKIDLLQRDTGPGALMGPGYECSVREARSSSVRSRSASSASSSSRCSPRCPSAGRCARGRGGAGRPTLQPREPFNAETRTDSWLARPHGLDRLSANLVAGRPLLLVIDDLHWCDFRRCARSPTCCPAHGGPRRLGPFGLRPAEAGGEDPGLLDQIAADPLEPWPNSSRRRYAGVASHHAGKALAREARQQRHLPTTR